MSTKTVLLTGARAPATLDLARSFYQLGYRVICVDSLGCALSRYSKAVTRFEKIASPVEHFSTFASDLQRIVKEENVGLLIPMCEEVLYVAQLKEKLNCSVFCPTFEEVEALHNKWSFYEMVKKYSPKTELLSARTLQPPYVVKPIYSRFAAQLEIVKKNREIENDPVNPKIAQSYVEGTSFCSYSVVISGKVLAHGAYEVLHSIGVGSAVSMKSIDDTEIEKFVSDFVQKRRYTGQIAFDFIRSSQKLYVIECNPRATSGVHLFKCNPKLAKAFLGEGFLKADIGSIYQEPLTMMWHGFKQKEIFYKRFWKHLFKGKNILLGVFDFGPLFALPLILFEVVKLTLFRKKKFSEALSEDVEYNGEALCELL